MSLAQWHVVGQILWLISKYLNVIGQSHVILWCDWLIPDTWWREENRDCCENHWDQLQPPARVWHTSNAGSPEKRTEESEPWHPDSPPQLQLREASWYTQHVQLTTNMIGQCRVIPICDWLMQIKRGGEDLDQTIGWTSQLDAIQ